MIYALRSYFTQKDCAEPQLHCLDSELGGAIGLFLRIKNLRKRWETVLGSKYACEEVGLIVSAVTTRSGGLYFYCFDGQVTPC